VNESQSVSRCNNTVVGRRGPTSFLPLDLQPLSHLCPPSHRQHGHWAPSGLAWSPLKLLWGLLHRQHLGRDVCSSPSSPSFICATVHERIRFCHSMYHTSRCFGIISVQSVRYFEVFRRDRLSTRVVVRMPLLFSPPGLISRAI
jgi:hypothetical protein